MKNKHCLLCGKNKRLVKAHIIPRGFWTSIKIDEKAARVYFKERKSKQSQSGIHDTNILCEDCDGKILGKWDKYAQELLLQKLESYASIYEKVITVGEFDYSKLKLFFMSVLWRASVTSDRFFEKVSLNSWESKLRQMILQEIPGNVDDFSVLITRYWGLEAKCMPEPRRCKAKSNGLNFYEFRLANYDFLIKVDQRKFPDFLEPYLLQPDKPLMIRNIDYKITNEYQIIVDNIRAYPE